MEGFEFSPEEDALADEWRMVFKAKSRKQAWQVL